MSLLLGLDSFNAICSLNSRLKEQALANTNIASNSEFSNYEPWMSCAEHRVLLSQLSGKFQKKDSIDIVVDNDRLTLLSELLSTSEDDKNLHLLLPNDSNRKIMSFDQTNTKNYFLEIQECIEYINNNAPIIAKTFNEVVSHIVPLEPRSRHSTIRKNGSGFSTHEFRGTIFLSLAQRSPVSRFENILNLVHELGHQVFFLYQCADDILVDDLYKPIYSVIRRTQRPAIQSFHALVASAYMFQFCMEITANFESIINNRYFNARVSELKNYLYDGLSAFEGTSFTKVGKLMFNEVGSLLLPKSQVKYAEFY